MLCTQIEETKTTQNEGKTTLIRFELASQLAVIASGLTKHSAMVEELDNRQMYSLEVVRN